MNTSFTPGKQDTRQSRWLVACAVTLTLAYGIARPSLSRADGERDVVLPTVPANLQVPAGNRLFLEGHAVGTQNYICLPAGSGVAWTFFGPQATLFDDDDEQIITHFLSPNPVESGKARATWQDSEDTSTVWGNKIADSSDPTFVAAGAIPWFLLQTVGSQSGPTSGDRLVPTTFIQRLNTFGGVAPATGCAASADIGAKALVPYTANYFFFKADKSRHSPHTDRR